MAEAMKEGIMKAMEEDYDGGYGGRNNGGKTMAEAMEEETMETMEEDYGGSYGGRNNEDYGGRLWRRL